MRRGFDSDSDSDDFGSECKGLFGVQTVIIL